MYQNSLRIVHLGDLTAGDRATLFDRRQSLASVTDAVRGIMRDVQARGDDALREYTERFDGARLDRIEVSSDEIDQAPDGIDPAVRAALEQAIASVRAFHEGQLPRGVEIETQRGVRTWREWRPIDRVGLYVPGGRAAYPSSVVMLAVPATIAGCPEVVLCTPPAADGSIPPVTLAAAEMVGVRRIFKLGGAQAIAAMTYGTASVPAVDKLFGAGNTYVTSAKLLAFPQCALDSPAGPSELLVLADETANPCWIAADLLSDAEHGPDSPAVLITTSHDLAERVAEEVELLLKTLPRQEIARTALEACGFILVVDSIPQAIEVTNEYAPEHLEIVTRAPRDVLSAIRHAGSIFLGAYAPNAAGDYATGTNHVLPTARAARAFGPVSVESFGRLVQCQELTPEGLASLAPTVTTLARAEGLEGHARAVEIRDGS
jgi:histidinol dehydrogenase